MPAPKKPIFEPRVATREWILQRIKEVGENPYEPDEAVKIFPDVAHWLLHDLRYENNRDISDDAVNEITEAILNDDFRCTHQGIAICAEGFTMDAQHRLAACIRADMPIIIKINFGQPLANFDVIDAVRLRHAGVLLKFAGIKNPAECAAATQWRHRLETRTMTSRLRIAPRKIVKLFKESYSTVADWLPQARKIKRMHGQPVGATMAMLDFFHGLDPGTAEDLAEAWGGAMTERFLPFKRLELRIGEIKRVAGRVHDTMRMAMIIKAWNAVRDNKPTASLNWQPKEPFPIPH